MTWALLLVIVAVVFMMSLNSSGQLPWAKRMRRVHAGVAERAEWMAPDEVVKQVTANYTAAQHWLEESILGERPQQLLTAPTFLAGPFLARYNIILRDYYRQGTPLFVGVQRCIHQVEVRHFSEDGARCLVIDHQMERRTATYDFPRRRRVMTQNFGDASLVYEMVYDRDDQRWKINALVQELPYGWARRGASSHIRVSRELPETAGIGRDN